MKIIKICLSGLVSLLISLSATADEGTWENAFFSTAVSINNKNVEFETNNTELNPVFNTIDIALNASMDKLYFSFNFGTSISDASDNIAAANIEFSRTDINITAGYLINDSLSVFGGFLSGETTYDFIDASNVTFLTGKTTEVGPFLGVSYSLPLQAGAVSGSVAFASLDGEDKSTDLTPTTVTDKGVTSGLSFSVKWTGELLNYESLSYFLGFKINRYKFESDLNPFEADENYTILTAGLAKYF